MALALDVYKPRDVEYAKNARSYAIFLRPADFNGHVQQYAGWAEMIGDTLHICILHDYFSDDKKLDPNVEAKLELLEFKSQHCIHRADPDDIVLVQGLTPAKF